MNDTTQISAHISFETKKRLDRYVRNFGVTRGHLIERALEHHLQALEEIPANFIMPKRIVLSAESAAKVREMTERPPEPTEALKELFDDR
jgi:predicted DNA-binding protein